MPPGKEKEWEKLNFLGPPCCTEELSPFFSCPPDQGNTSYGKTPRRGHQNSFKPYWSHVVQVCIFASSVVVWQHSNHWCLLTPKSIYSKSIQALWWGYGRTWCGVWSLEMDSFHLSAILRCISTNTTWSIRVEFVVVKNRNKDCFTFHQGARCD